MRVLVCGGRDFENVGAVNRAMDTLHAREPVTLLIEGGARGADTLARVWAQNKGIEVRTFYADWKTHGKKAGHLRNEAMMDQAGPELVVAFPGGRGTDDMQRIAHRAGVPVWRPFPKMIYWS